MSSDKPAPQRNDERRFPAACRAIFYFGVIVVILFGFGDQWPPGQQRALTVAAAMLAFGLLVPKKAYRVAAVCLIAFALFKAYEAHQKAVPIREKLKQIGLDP